MSDISKEEEIRQLRRLLDAAAQRNATLEFKVADAAQRILELTNEVGFLQQQVTVYQAQVARLEGERYSAEQRHQLVQSESQQRQLRIGALEQENRQLQGRIAEFEGRVSTEPARFGSALGQAIDAIQQGMTALSNPYVDYGLQELDLQTQVNLHLSDGQLQMRFPGLNEEIAPQNLSGLHLRLRPIPKQQQDEPVEM